MKQETKGRLLTVFSVAALAVVVVAPAAASWHGLVAAGRDVFGLKDGWEYVVPLTLDGAALYAGTLAMRATLSGDSALGARALTALYAMAASAFNGYHALHVPGGNVPAALFFAGASVSAVVLWDVTLRALRRDQLRSLGAIEAPLPRWRLLRWVVAPISTARAWRLAVIEQITDPTEALRISAARRNPDQNVRTAVAERVNDVPALTGANNEGGTDEQEHDAGDEEQWTAGEAGQSAAGRRGAGDADQVPERVGRSGGQGLGSVHGRGAGRDDVRPAADGELTDDQAGALRATAKRSKKAAVRTAFDYLGRRDVPAALELLSQHGVIVDRSYAYTVTWTPQLQSVDHNTVTPQSHNTVNTTVRSVS